MTGSFLKQQGEIMRSLSEAVVNFLKNEDGPTAVEYAIMLALIILVCYAAVGAMGSSTNNSFSNTSLNAAAGS